MIAVLAVLIYHHVLNQPWTTQFLFYFLDLVWILCYNLYITGLIEISLCPTQIKWFNFCISFTRQMQSISSPKVDWTWSISMQLILINLLTSPCGPRSNFMGLDVALFIFSLFHSLYYFITLFVAPHLENILAYCK